MTTEEIQKLLLDKYQDEYGISDEEEIKNEKEEIKKKEIAYVKRVNRSFGQWKRRKKKRK